MLEIKRIVIEVWELVKFGEWNDIIDLVEGLGVGFIYWVR